MHHFLQLRLSYLGRDGRILWIAPLALLLAACGREPLPQTALEPERFDFVASVRIDPTATAAEVEALYGGSVVVVRPEAAFATLGFDRGEGSLTPMNAGAGNQDAFRTPEAAASGWTATVPGAPHKAVIVAYETGAEMVELFAPARRVGFFFQNFDVDKYGYRGITLFDAAVMWATSGGL